MNQTTVARLDADFAEYPMLVAGPVEEAAVNELEAAVGFQLPSDYRAFVMRYGGAIVGAYSIYGVGASDAMGDNESSAMQVTERFRMQKWPGTGSALVVSTDHAGNAITLNAEGRVHRFDHDNGTTEQLAESFEDLIVNWCLKA